MTTILLAMTPLVIIWILALCEVFNITRAGYRDGGPLLAVAAFIVSAILCFGSFGCLGAFLFIDRIAHPEDHPGLARVRAELKEMRGKNG